jgi:hypothetical protein
MGALLLSMSHPPSMAVPTLVSHPDVGSGRAATGLPTPADSAAQEIKGDFFKPESG